MNGDQRGQTVIDLVLGSALLLLVVAVLGLLLGITQTGFSAAGSKAGAETAARQLLDGLQRRIRSARPVGWCPSAARGAQYSTPSAACTHVSAYSGWPLDAPEPGGPIIFADPHQLWFWDDGETSVDPLAVPACTRVSTTSAGNVVVDTWPGTGSFSDTSCPGVSFTRNGPPVTTGEPPTSLFVSSSGATFRTTDAAGNPTASPPDIALVSISASFPFRSGVGSSASGRYDVVVAAAVRATVYRHEQRWDAR